MTYGKRMRDILTTAQAASLLGISTRTAQLWVESGQLLSWKTPGGHRRIPRQAVLDLIHRPPHEQALIGAYAVVLAGEGRAARWHDSGLPGLGLLVRVVEDIESFRELLKTAPMLIVVEKADAFERAELVSELLQDFRFPQTTLVSLVMRGAGQARSLGPRHIQMKMLPDPAETGEVVASYLIGLRTKENSSTFPTPWSEPERLLAVTNSGLLDTPADPAFDRLVRLAALAVRAPIAMFTLLTESEQRFKSRTGFDEASTPRDWAFCNETLINNQLTIIEDLSQSSRFSHNPALNQPYGFRFYAGAPVRDPQGFALGSTCVIDTVPRKLDEQEREALCTVADAATNLIRIRALEGDARRLPNRQ